MSLFFVMVLLFILVPGTTAFANEGIQCVDPAYQVSYYAVSPPPTTMVPGNTYSVTLMITNNGTLTWHRYPPNNVDLGYFWEKMGGASVACTWGEGRFLLPYDVAPGGYAIVTADIKPPTSGGNWVLKFDMVHEGVTWFNWRGCPTYDFSVTVPGLYDADYSVTGAFGAQCVPGGQSNFTVNVTNNGSLTWKKSGTAPNPVNLSYHWYNAQGQLIAWDCVRTVLPSDVAPGQALDVPVSVTAPYPQGTYILRFDLVQEGRTWFTWQGVPPSAPQTASVPSTFGATYQVIGGFTDPMTPGGQANFTVNVTNTGFFTWQRQAQGVSNPVNLAFHWYTAQGQLIAWDCVRTVLPADVAPGQSLDVPVTVTAPYPQGTYILKFDLVQEGRTWFSWQGVPVSAAQTANVPSIYGATYQITGGFYDPMPPGGMGYFYVNLTNTGYFTWKRTGTGPNPVNLAFHWYNAQGQLIAWDCVRTALPTDVAPGQSVMVPVSIYLPNVPHSTYVLRFDLVHEGAAWFSWRGVPLSAAQTANIQ
jgi:hypothetical protein